MFDWAKGSRLKIISNLNDENVNYKDFDAPANEWLKSWSAPWIKLAIEYQPGLKVLDVGSGTPVFSQTLHDLYGIDANALDLPPSDHYAERSEWGFSPKVKEDYPNVTMHLGLAGENILPAESYDVVLCNSVIEHTYDTTFPCNPQNPFGHLNALRDMCRMLRPGGLLVQNWDTYLDGVPHHAGWDYMTDIWALLNCGMKLADPTQTVKTPQQLMFDPDTLFFSPRAVNAFSGSQWPHAVSINTIWRKPGAPAKAKVSKIPGVSSFESLEIPSDEVADSTAEIENKFLGLIEKAKDAFQEKV